VKKGVEVITDLETARVLVDPMRREVVRLLADRPMTENKLAEALGLSDPSVGHHLKILKQSGLIRIVRKQAEEHGIVQKFYETTAAVYLIDGRGMPLEIERYFMPVRLERALGIVSALSIASKESRQLSTRDVEDFAKALDSAIIDVAHNHSRQRNEDREEIIRKMYRDALMHLLKKPEGLPETIRGLLVPTSKRKRS